MSSHGPCYTFHFLCLILTTVLRFGATRIAIIYGPYFFFFFKELCELYMEQKLKTIPTTCLLTFMLVIKFFDYTEYKTAITMYKVKFTIYLKKTFGNFFIRERNVVMLQEREINLKKCMFVLH